MLIWQRMPPTVMRRNCHCITMRVMWMIGGLLAIGWCEPFKHVTVHGRIMDGLPVNGGSNSARCHSGEGRCNKKEFHCNGAIQRPAPNVNSMCLTLVCFV